jgi:type II secretory pathway predicted ATPase ExeA
MRAEVMEFYGLTRSPRAVGYYETTHHRQLLQDIKQAVYDGDLVALCGVVGAGKTVTLRRLQEMLARENGVTCRFVKNCTLTRYSRSPLPFVAILKGDFEREISRIGRLRQNPCGNVRL